MAVYNKEYIDQYKSIHKQSRYGVSGYKFIDQVQLCIAELRPSVVLDYGCGQTDLSGSLLLNGASFFRFDPAIEAVSKLEITKADFVINTDVMEHIPSQDIDDVLGFIRSLTDNAFFSIATNAAQEVLPNGSNAHCSVLTQEQWLNKIRKHFPDAILIESKRRGACIIVTWRTILKDQLEKLDELYYIRRRLEKWSPSYRWNRFMRKRAAK